VGIAVVGATAILAKIFLFSGKKKKSLITLKDPTIKYPLRLIDKEVSFIVYLRGGMTQKIDIES
jgi:hypothetical protein